MAKKKKDEEVELSKHERVLLHAKDQLKDYVIVGVRVDGNGTDVVSTLDSYADVQYLLSKGSFEMHLHQKANEVKKETE